MFAIFWFHFSLNFDAGNVWTLFFMHLWVNHISSYLHIYVRYACMRVCVRECTSYCDGIGSDVILGINIVYIYLILEGFSSSQQNVRKIKLCCAPIYFSWKCNAIANIFQYFIECKFFITFQCYAECYSRTEYCQLAVALLLLLTLSLLCFCHWWLAWMRSVIPWEWNFDFNFHLF